MPEIIKAMNRVGVNPGKLSPLFKCYMKKDKFRGTETPVFQGRIVWDTMKAYAELQPTKLPDSSLEAISQKVLGEGTATIAGFLRLVTGCAIRHEMSKQALN